MVAAGGNGRSLNATNVPLKFHIISVWTTSSGNILYCGNSFLDQFKISLQKIMKK
jgi:hypothetical protein